MKTSAGDYQKFMFWLAAGVAGLVIFGGGGYVTYTYFKQRGIRNNNPGNLIITDIAWKGKTPKAQNTDGHFEQFADSSGHAGHIWGIRAMFMDIRGDITKKNQNTPRKLITAYAPKFENNTAAYITAVAAGIGKSADAMIQPSDYPALIAAIIKHENGVQPYPTADIQKAISLA